MLTPRSEMPAIELNGLIYVPGGFGPVRGGLANGKGPVTSFDVYDPRTDTWTALAPMPEARHHMMLAAYKDKLYVFGGFAGVWETYSNVWVYDVATNTWEVRNPMPASRTAGAAVTLGDFIYLVGGTTSRAGGILPTWRYDPATDLWTDLAPLQEPREHLNAAVLDGKIYALAGRWTTTLNSIEIYDPATDQWTYGPAMNDIRAGFGATVMDGKIYVAGGEIIETSKTVKSMEAYDPGTKTWSYLEEMPLRLHGVVLCGLDHTLFVIGGSGRAADVIGVGELTRRHQIPLIEDCAQAHGARVDGRHVGTFGQMGCFSFYPTKNLGAIGDGGLVATGDPAAQVVGDGHLQDRRAEDRAHHVGRTRHREEDQREHEVRAGEPERDDRHAPADDRPHDRAALPVQRRDGAERIHGNDEKGGRGQDRP